MMSASKNFCVASLLAVALLATMCAASPPTADAAEVAIKLGNTAPYSGPASAYGTIARAEAAYFQMLNDQGGINGRRIEFLSLDDAYSPAKTVEQTRKLAGRAGRGAGDVQLGRHRAQYFGSEIPQH